MIKTDIHNVLVIGIDVLSLATSAKRSGYRVFAVDYFGDQDLEHVCHGRLSIVKQIPGVSCGQISTNFDPEALLELATALLEKNAIDVTLLSTGLDDSQDVLCELNDVIPILGNLPDAFERIRDKMKFFQELKRLGIPHPETGIAEDFEEAKRKVKEVGYPVVVKPSKGFGGIGIRKVHGIKELKQAVQGASRIDQRALIQNYVSGTPASISLISTTSKAITLTINEQLLGVNKVGQEEPFGYCGNVVPLKTTRSVTNRCKNIAERITSHFGLVGSNGIDFVISKEGTPYVVEVNPRFQATLECVERFLGINMVQAHMRACLQGKLPSIVGKTDVFCTRLILFAPQLSIVPDLSLWHDARDMPMPGVIVERGEPFCSIVVEGTSREFALKKAMTTAEKIYKSLKPLR